jgi:hypothetical protein
MSYDPQDKEFLLEVAKGNIPKHSLVNKFGFNGSIGSTLVPVSTSGTYATPTVATALEVVSDDTGDTAAGAGAREVTVIGLDANFDQQIVAVATDGTTPVALTGTWMRVYRAYVSASGTYASQAGGSHIGEITIQVSGAGAIWAAIDIADSGFPSGQTEIAAYTVPRGHTGYLLSKHATIESSKTPDIVWFRRGNANVVVAPFSPMRVFETHYGAGNEITYGPSAPAITLEAMTDVGAMGHVATGTAAISIEFQILLVQD